jgi:hypothetical protein
MRRAIDATPIRDQQIVVALGIGCDGRKTVLGLRERATENTRVMGALLTDLEERGLDFSTPPLCLGWRQSTACRGVQTRERGSLRSMRWQGGDQIERWVGSGLLVAEQQFRKVIGFASFHCCLQWRKRL